MKYTKKSAALALGAVLLTSSIGFAEGYQVVVRDNGVNKTYTVSSRNVETIIKEINIPLGPMDYIEKPKNDTLKKGEGLQVHRVSMREETREQAIPFEWIDVENPEMYVGEAKVVQEGIEGLREEQVISKVDNGAVVSSIILSSSVKREPVNRVTEVGTKERPQNRIAGKKYKKKITMHATAYDPSAGSRTASGTRARVGAVAVDPRVIPLGTKLYIESTDSFPTYGFAVAEDTGGAIKGNRIDLFYGTNREARHFGRRNVTVYVLDEE